MTEKIIIQELISNIDEDSGFNKESWIDYYKCWAEYKTIGWKEYFSAKAMQSENTVTFIIRYSLKINTILESKQPTKKYRISYKNRNYDINYLEDIGNRHNFIEIKAEFLS